MNATELSAIAGLVLSLAFSYIPGLRAWYDNLDGDYKRLVMAVCLFVVAGAAFGLSCGGVITAVACDKVGALGLINAFIAALVVNQSVYRLSPRGRH